MKLNYWLLAKIVGLAMLIVALSTVPSIICAIIYSEAICLRAFIVCFVIFMLLSLSVSFIANKDKRNTLGLRDSHLIVFSAWMACSLIGAVPYMLTGQVTNFGDAFFESAAGFTTTGVTAFYTDLIPRSLLMYKAITHWLGGMGILVLTITVLPALGIGAQNLMQAEAPGPKFEKMSNRVSDSARILYIMYFSFTVAQFLLLVIHPDIDAYESIINTLSTVSTGGILSDSTGKIIHASPYLELMVAIFAILASVNFTLYFYVIQRRFKDFIDNVELRVFLVMIAVITILVTIDLLAAEQYSTFAATLGHAFSQVVSFITTSGYSFTNYHNWPLFSKMLLFFLLFVGGCASSTSGSIKIIRILVIFKLILRGFARRMHPRSVVAVKIQGKAIPSNMVSSISTFVLVYILLVFLGAGVLSFSGMDFFNCLSTSAGILSNTGIWINGVGSTTIVAALSVPYKVFLSMLMIAGRLELFTVIYIFTPWFWGKARS